MRGELAEELLPALEFLRTKNINTFTGVELASEAP